MKRALFIIISVLLALVLPACASPAGAGQSQTSSQAVFPPAERSASPSPAEIESPMPEPAPVFVPDTDISGIFKSMDKTVAYSSDYINSCLREDKNNIYYASSIDDYNNTITLFCVNKKTRGIKIVSNDVCSFALCGGKVYYSSYYKTGSAVKSYNPVTGKTKRIKNFKNSVFDMASYKGRLYFTYETVYHEDYDIPLTDLYVMKPDGSRLKKIRDNAACFCIYKDIIYYNESSWPDGAPVDRCKLNGSGCKQILDWTDYFTAVCDNKIYYYDGSNEMSMDISSGKTTKLSSFFNDPVDDYGCFAPLGKYILNLSEGKQITPNITAFDTVSNTTYYLMELDKDYYYDMYTSPYGAYLVWIDSIGKVNMDRIVISNGKASLEKVAEFTLPSPSPATAPPDEIAEPTDMAGPEPTALPEPTSDAY